MRKLTSAEFATLAAAKGRSAAAYATRKTPTYQGNAAVAAYLAATAATYARLSLERSSK